MVAELLHVDSGHQASPVFTIILSFLNIAYTLLVQLSFIKAASACILEGLHTDVYHLYTKPFTWSETNSCLLSHTLLEVSSADGTIERWMLDMSNASPVQIIMSMSTLTAVVHATFLSCGRRYYLRCS